jgi:hypothetical protein
MPPFEVRKEDWTWLRNKCCVGVKIETPPWVSGQPPFEVSMKCVRVGWCCRREIVIPVDSERTGFRSAKWRAGVSLQFVRLWR